MSGPAIAAASAADVPAACRALYAYLPEPDRTTRAARARGLIEAGDIDPAGLLVATVRGLVVGAILTQLHPGATALAWPPGAEAGHAALDALAAAAVARLRAAGAKQAQLVQPPADRPHAAPLERAGFRRVTQLTFRGRPTGEAERSPAPAGGLAFAPVVAPEPPVGELLAATYVGTLDCPELNNARTPAEVLAGYWASAARGPGPPAWFVASAGGTAVGLVMLDPGPKPGVRELTYLGLVPAARGRGFGRELLRFALRHAAAAGDEWVILSADMRNVPALRLYDAADFRAFDVQDVFLWTPAG